MMALSDLSMREKWFGLLKGQDVGPMVSPLCDDWALPEPYRWPYDEPEPFRKDKWQHDLLNQQMAMAKVCGWDPTFLTALTFTYKNPDIEPISKSQQTDRGTTVVENCIHTPFGDLTSTSEHATDSNHFTKEWLITEDDYRKAIWLTKQQMEYNEDAVIEEGKLVLKGIGNRGVVGTWSGPPYVNLCNREQMFYHMADWPEAFEELHTLTLELILKQYKTLRKAGLDYLFFVVEGTEWISPGFFKSHLQKNIHTIFDQWRADGGFILWHTCGLAKIFLEADFYNEYKPEIFETLSVPPVGNLPSLKWARERLDPAIITKGNIPLDTLLYGPEETIRAAVRQVKEDTRGYRHIVGLSDDLLHNTPLANCRAFVEEARKPLS